MGTQLTAGALKEIFSDNQVDNAIVQVLGTKLVHSAAQPRYRFLVSDGEYQTASSMVGVQLNDLAEGITSQSIIQINRYIVNTVNKVKKIMIILDMNVLHPGDEVGEVIGSPANLDSIGLTTGMAQSEAKSQENASRSSLANGAETSGPASGGFASNARPAKSFVSSPAASRPAGAPGIHPISSLNPYQNKWTICARVTNKSDIRTWSNSRGQGKLFSMDLLDQSGEIRATAFNEQCDKFYNMIKLDKVYYITQAQLKTANKQYSSLKNDYEMTFNQGTQVTPCQEQTNIPTMQFEFVSIDQIENVEKEMTVDVIGVCKQADDVSTITARTTGKELKKRDLQIVDQSGREIRLTLWGNAAENFDGSLNPIVAVKGVKVSDFGGKSLSVLSSSTFQLNPDIKESHKLRAWFESTGGNLQTTNLSNQRTLGGGMGGNFKTISEASLENLGCNDQADYYVTKAMPCLFRKENCLYMACPSDGCNKKVIDHGTGMYRCEKCNKEYGNFNWRLMLSASVSDSTDNVWVTLFSDQGEQMLDCKSAELGVLKEEDPTRFDAIFNEALFKEYIFKFRVKMETFNDERRLKTTVVTAQPLDCKEYNSRLIQQIKSMAGIGNA